MCFNVRVLYDMEKFANIICVQNTKSKKVFARNVGLFACQKGLTHETSTL